MRYGSHRRGGSAALSLLLMAGSMAAAYAISRAGGSRIIHHDEDAPARSLRHPADGAARIVGRTVTIGKPRHDVYAAWRDFSGFPSFMENVRSVEQLEDDRSHWSVYGPGGALIEFDSRIVEDVPGERISWKSEEGAFVPNTGTVTFRDAPGGRGTEVDLTITYEPPGGAVGAVIAKMFQREPNIQARRDLKRFKQWMETGEIATQRPHP
jgi:uncharacterized membrane protein